MVKILDTVEIITGQNTNTLGSVYETGLTKTLCELHLELPTYRAHEDNLYTEK